MVAKYFIPKVDFDLQYSCFLETYQENNETLFIPILKESNGLRADQKPSKFDSYKFIRGRRVGGDDDELHVVTLSKANVVQDRVVNNYEDIFDESTMIPITKENIPRIKKYFEDNSTRSIQIKTDFEDVIDCADIEDGVSSSQPLGDFKHTIRPDDFLINSDLAITEFTMPLYGLSYAIFRSLDKLLKFINKNPALKNLYDTFMGSSLFQLFSTKTGNIVGSASFDSYLTKNPAEALVVKELLGVKSVFKGVVENVSKIHDKPEVRFVRFIQTLIQNMRNTLVYRGNTQGSRPFKLLDELEKKFNEIMAIYLDPHKPPGGCVSQAKCQQLINIAVTMFEASMRNMGKPIHQWSLLDSLPRRRMKLAIAENPQDLSKLSLNLTQQKLLQNEAAVLDAVGGKDIKGFTGKSDTKIVVANGMKCDGSPPSYNKGEDSIDLLLDFDVGAQQNQAFYGIQVVAFPVKSKVTCIMEKEVEVSGALAIDVSVRECDTHMGDAGLFAVLVDPVYDIDKEFCEHFHVDKPETKNKTVCPCAAFYILAKAIPSSHGNQEFLNALDAFYDDADKTFNEGVQMRKADKTFTGYTKWIPSNKGMKFKRFVIINGLLYVLVSFIDTINGGISNNMTMYLICQHFPEAATFRGACSSMSDCKKLFEQTTFKVFQEKYFTATLTQTQRSDWANIVCQIGLNSKEVAGDQFKKFFGNIANLQFGIKCLLGTGDFCLMYGLSGDGISLAVFRSMLSWLPHGTTELPELTAETVLLIAKYQFLLMIYGSYETDDNDQEKNRKITEILGKLSLLSVSDVTQKKKTFDTLTQFSQSCHTKLKTNIVKCYKKPELDGLLKRLTILRERISPVSGLPDVGINSQFNYLRLLRIYLVYLTQYNKLLLDGPTVLSVEEPDQLDIDKSMTDMLQPLDRFNDIVSNPMTGTKISNNKPTEFICSDQEGFTDLVVLPEKTNGFEAVEGLMAKASGDVNDCVALNALKSMVLNDQGLLELYKVAYQTKKLDDAPDEGKVSDYKKYLAKLAPITLNEFDIFELLKLKQVLLSTHEIQISGSGSRGVSLTATDIENSLHGAIARAFDIFIEGLTDVAEMTEQKEFIRYVQSNRMPFVELECQASAANQLDPGTTSSVTKYQSPVLGPGGGVAAASNPVRGPPATTTTTTKETNSARPPGNLQLGKTPRARMDKLPDAGANTAPVAPPGQPPETTRKLLKKMQTGPNSAPFADDDLLSFPQVVGSPFAAGGFVVNDPFDLSKVVRPGKQTVTKNTVPKNTLLPPLSTQKKRPLGENEQPFQPTSKKPLTSAVVLPKLEEPQLSRRVPQPPSERPSGQPSRRLSGRPSRLLSEPPETLTKFPGIYKPSGSTSKPSGPTSKSFRDNSPTELTTRPKPNPPNSLPPDTSRRPSRVYVGVPSNRKGGNSRKLKNKQHNITKKYRTKTRKSRQTRRNKHKYKHTRTIKRRKSRRNNSN